MRILTTRCDARSRDRKSRTFQRTVYLAFHLAIALLLVCASGTGTIAQDLDDARLNGVVTDQNGAVLPGASVTATLLTVKTARVVLTDGDGRYRLVELPPGSYSVRVECAGFAVEEKSRLELAAGRSVSLDFTLRPADVRAEQVVVSAAHVPLVDTTRTVVGGTLGRDEL